MNVLIYLTLVIASTVVYILIKKVIAYEKELSNEFIEACKEEGLEYTQIKNGENGELLVFNKDEIIAKYIQENKRTNENKYQFVKVG